MKFLMMMALSMTVTTSAFAACGVTSPAECTTKESCEGLSKADGQKFNFLEKEKVKCQIVSTEKATTCLQGSTVQGAKATETTADGKAATSTDLKR
jgi:hypothetical protein